MSKEASLTQDEVWDLVGHQAHEKAWNYFAALVPDSDWLIAEEWVRDQVDWQVWAQVCDQIREELL